MTKFASVLLVAAFAINAQAANDTTDSKYFQLTKVKTADVTAEYNARFSSAPQAALSADCEKSQKQLLAKFSSDVPVAGDLDPLTTVEVILDRVINMGKKVWAIMDAGRPVVNVQAFTANALPQGVGCWADLTGWNVPESKVYRVTYENAFGMDVVTFAYRVGYTAGGSLNGQGQYITNANISPADLQVNWGFTLNAQGEVPSVFNMGTKEAPVAGMQMLMKWQVKSVMSDVQSTEAFFVGGNNTMKHLE